jgi:hypothetical protein
MRHRTSIVLMGLIGLTVLGLGIGRVLAGPNFAEPPLPSLTCQNPDNASSTLLDSQGGVVAPTSALAMADVVNLWNLTPATFSFYGTVTGTDYYTLAIGLDTKAVAMVDAVAGGWVPARGDICDEVLAPAPYLDEPNP